MHLHTGKGVPEMGDVGRGKGKYPFFRVCKIKMLVIDDCFGKQELSVLLLSLF